MDYAAEAAKTLKTHQYTCLASTDEVEVWKCRREDSAVHSCMYISITPMGMSVVGDYDPVIFRVGKDYGLPFMARDVDGYYCEKLDECTRREVEFDAAKAASFLRDACRNVLENEGLEIPEEFKDKEDEYAQKVIDAREAHMRLPIGRVTSVMEDANGITATLAYDKTQPVQHDEAKVDDEAASELYELLELAEDVEHGRIERTEQFYEALSAMRHHETDEYPRVDSYTENLMYRLHMVSHMAKAIIKIKFPETDRGV